MGKNLLFKIPFESRVVSEVSCKSGKFNWLQFYLELFIFLVGLPVLIDFVLSFAEGPKDFFQPRVIFICLFFDADILFMQLFYPLPHLLQLFESLFDQIQVVSL